MLSISTNCQLEMQPINLKTNLMMSYLITILKKDFNSFRKRWKQKVQTSRPTIARVAGQTDDGHIANEFAKHFGNIGVSRITPLSPNIVNTMSTSMDRDTVRWLFSVEDVDNAVSKMKFCKAARGDGITTAHLKYSHPSIVLHLKNLFNSILTHGYVPNSFGHGVTVQLLKNRLSDPSVLDNYRAITVSSVIIIKGV